jgi:cell fate (sporulation/competence/biofilm development) regulator YlbF (YheA/YmcA/DUF963 family)
MPASDYFIDIGDPFAKSMAAFRGAYGDVERLRRFGEERQERQRVAQERQSGMDALQNLARLGNNATSGDYMSALAANPAFGQQIGAMQKTFGAERSANELRFGQRLFSALAGDNIDLSKQMLDERIAAYRNAGDNRAADSAQAIRLMLDKPGGLGAARASVGMTLANGMGDSFDKFLKQFYPQQKEMTAETRGRLEQLRLAGMDPASPEGRRFLLTGSLGEQFRPATPEEAARYGASAGQVDTKTGRFYPINPPTGMTIEQTPDGGFKFVQGTTTAATKAAQQRSNLDADIDAAQRNLDLIEDIIGDKSLGEVTGMVWGRLPARTQSQYNLMAKMDQLGGAAFLQAFQNLKGGGQITEKEGEKAQAAIARLQRTQDLNAYKQALKEFSEVIAAGTERAKALRGQFRSEDGSSTINGVRIRRIN